MAKVSPEPMSGCWIFAGAVNNEGYGIIGRGGKKAPLVLAHRAMYEHHFGPIPAGLVVMHRCDVRCCVNPAHLRAATQRENMRDCVAKGRNLNAVIATRRRTGRRPTTCPKGVGPLEWKLHLRNLARTQAEAQP